MRREMSMHTFRLFDSQEKRYFSTTFWGFSRDRARKDVRSQFLPHIIICN